MNEPDPRLELLRQRYMGSFPAKHAALAQAWAAFAAEPDDTARRRELAMQVHRLAGSAGAYGYERLGERAGAADHLIGNVAGDARGGETVQQIEPGVRAVLEELSAAAAASSAPSRASELRVVLVQEAPSPDASLAAALNARGCNVRVESRDRLWQVLTIWPCHAVVLDARLPVETAVEIASVMRCEPLFARIGLLRCVESGPPALPAIDYVVLGDDGGERLFEAVRAAAARVEQTSAAA